MLRHCVMFKWKPEVEAGHIETLARGLDDLARMDVVRGYRHGPDLGFADTNYDYSVVADFDDVAGWQAYRDDAGHQRLIAELLVPFITERAAVQFDLSE
jgi:hypothetical protein